MSKSKTQPKILIVGAGPTGLTAAVELARRGIVADIVDKRDAASTWSRAVGILPSSLKLLEPSGVTAQLLKAGINAQGVHVYRHGRQALSVVIQTDVTAAETLIALPQDETERFLRGAFEGYGGRVAYGRALKGLSQIPDAVLATFEDGSEQSYDYVIGADGTDSLVRESQDIAFNGIVIEGEWSIADVDAVDWPHPQSFCAFLNKGGEVVVVVPIGTERYRIISDRTEALSRLPVPMNVTNIRRAGDFNIPVKQAATYKKGRVFLAGDAAHCHSPVGGRGMNVGIGDAVDLARRFAENDLDGYSAARHPIGRNVIRLTERGRKIVTSGNPVTGWALGRVIALVDKSPRLQKRMVDFLLYG